MNETELRESLSIHLVVLDEDGTTVEVNRAWRRFGVENGLAAPNHCLGVNYLALCKRALGIDHRLTRELGALLRGKTALISWVYPCHASGEKRWFNLIGVPRKGAPGALLAHVDLTPLALKAGWEDGPVVETSLPALTPVSRPSSAVDRGAKAATRKSLAGLSPSQAHTLRLVGSGLTNAEIASELGVSPGMVKKHVAFLLRYFGVASRGQLRDFCPSAETGQAPEANPSR